MAAPESPEAVLESLVGEIADEFTRRHQRGEAPRLEEYTQRYPELAELLREILPAIQALGPARGHAAGDTPRAIETHGPDDVAEFARIPPDERNIGEFRNLADYEIVAEIGRGGMGVVYKARHRTLGRIVALKMLRSQDAADLERFRREAEAVARLQHPNVVQIFEVQEADGRPFLALEYVDGGSLAERIKGEPQPPREAAALVETLARAMAAAHERGLVHRDLKPGNVLLSACGLAAPDGAAKPRAAECTPKITDFGLAKRLDQDLGQTQTGAIVGTPSYMAPEQAIGGTSVGPAADIFALGAILYELIAGRPPFKGPSILETLELVRHAEPTPPAQLQPGCPRDLETICLKCLCKEPARRYASATLLADDLRRFLGGEPIHARPVGHVERLGKWLRRRPAVAASIGLGALAALAVVTLSVRLSYSWELEDANQKLGEAVGAKEAALVATHEARRLAEQNHQEADDARLKLDAALERERALHYVHSISLAQREWQANRQDEARRLLDACPTDLRHWEWHYLHRQCHAELLTLRGHIGGIWTLAISPDSKLIAAASLVRRLGAIEWDLRIWDAATGKLVRELAGHQRAIADVAFSPDGAVLASASYDQTIRLWDVKSGRELRKITGTTTFSQVAFSPDGTRLAAAVGPEIRIFEVAGGRELFALVGHTGAVQGLAFSSDGARLVSGALDRFVKLWDLNSRKEIFSSRGPGAIRSVAFSPKQDQIVSCGSGGTAGAVRGEVRLWNVPDGKQTPLNISFPYALAAAEFSGDAAHIACAGGDGSVALVHAKTGKVSFTFRGHADVVTQLAFTPDGARLVTGSTDGTIRVWPAQNPEFVELAEVPFALALAFTGDANRLALSNVVLAAPRGGTAWVRVLPVAAPRNTLELQGTKPMMALTFAPDQRWLAAAEQHAVTLWDLDKAAPRGVIAEPGVVDLCISPDGQRLATATRNPAVDHRPDLGKSAYVKVPVPPQPGVAIKIWRASDGRLEHVLPGQIAVAFSPDGQRLAGAADCSVKIWDVATAKELRTFTGPADPLLKVQFVADGRQIVGFTYRQAMIWDADTGRTLATVDGLKGPAIATRDGRRLVSLHGPLIKWWDVKLGRELLYLTGPEKSFAFLALSHDGRRLAAAGAERVVMWEAAQQP